MYSYVNILRMTCNDWAASMGRKQWGNSNQNGKHVTICIRLPNITFYNIAFVNSERWLAKSRVDTTQCQHGEFSAACKHGNFSYPSGFDIAIL
jgi:outer membrane protease